MSRSSRKRIAIGVGIVAVATAVVAVVADARYEARRCELLLPGIWFAPPRPGVTTGTYHAFLTNGQYLIISELEGELPPEIRPGKSTYQVFTYELRACRVSVEPVAFTVAGNRSPISVDRPVLALRTRFERVNELVLGPEDSAAFGRITRVTDPPAWLEELLASVPDVEETER